MQLSIVIPVYNVEKYISRCLDSCVNQDYDASEYEIIVVNDGTPDNSVAIIEQYVAKYSNLRLINRKNGGLSAARNTGLKEAKGKYVWFVDSDDWIEQGAIKAIASVLAIDADVIGIQYKLVYDDITLNRDVIGSKVDGVKNGEYVLINGGLSVPAQFKVYKRLFLNNESLVFSEGYLHEDAEFYPRMLLAAKSVIAIDNICYCYYKGNSESITAIHKFKNVAGYINAAESTSKLSLDCRNECKTALNRIVARSVNGAMYSLVRIKDDKEKEKALKFLAQKKYLCRFMVESKKLFYILEGLGLRFSPKFFSLIYAFFKK